MAFINLTTSDAMSVGIIRNRGLADTSNFNDTVHYLINPYQTIHPGDKVSFIYQGVSCEAEISQIVYPESNITENIIQQNNTAPLVESYPLFKVRVFACGNYSVLPEGNECFIQASDIILLTPMDYSS